MTTGSTLRRQIEARAYLHNIDELLADLDRLQRRTNGDEYTSHLAERIRDRVETIDSILWPAAADLVAAGHTIDQALNLVDRRTHHLRGPQ